MYEFGTMLHDKTFKNSWGFFFVSGRKSFFFISGSVKLKMKTNKTTRDDTTMTIRKMGHARAAGQNNYDQKRSTNTESSLKDPL